MLETISIIIPIYNVEFYLRKCLDSIVEQSFPYFELLLINDGSGQICQEYIEKDERIRYFEKENGGVSSAPNFGIKQSRGKYITFIDSDDWVEPNYLEIFYKTIKEKDADIVVTNYCTFREKDAMFLFHVAETNEALHKAPYCYRDRGDSASKAPGEKPIYQILKVSEDRLLNLALAGVDLTKAREHHIGLLQ